MIFNNCSYNELEWFAGTLIVMMGIVEIGIGIIGEPEIVFLGLITMFIGKLIIADKEEEEKEAKKIKKYWH